ncbi:MAG: M23 family metallopeptidase [Alphaproteobacteria bacterium]
MMRLALVAPGCFLSTSAWADGPPPAFVLPVDCVMGERCIIQNHFDHDPGDGYAGYACGTLSYDGEQGTDLRVADLVAMTDGVAVAAAAPGRVLRTRDHMIDIDVRDIGLDTVKGRDAGNAVVIDHGGGWETQYSHLRQGSIVVKPGDPVMPGDMLGMIGMSGRAEFPHVAFQVRHHDVRIDPFTGEGERDEPCGVGEGSLWTAEALAALIYQPTGLLRAGFSTGRPVWQAIGAASIAPIACPATPRRSFIGSVFSVARRATSSASA